MATGGAEPNVTNESSSITINKRSISDSNMLTLSSPTLPAANGSNSATTTPPGSPSESPTFTAFPAAEMPPSPSLESKESLEEDDEDAVGKSVPRALNVKTWLPEDQRIGLISATTLTEVVDAHYSSPLPEVDAVFPWLHGLHSRNISQRAFLDPLKRYRDRPFSAQNFLSDIKAPTGVRGLMIIKVGDVHNRHGSLVGSVAPEEILARSDDNNQFIPHFLFLDPEDGICLRNFQIQVAKWACISDMAIYIPDFANDRPLAICLARKIADAQENFRQQHPHVPKYSTYLVDDTMDQILNVAPHIVAVPPSSCEYDEDELRLKNWDSNFLFHERVEMSMMSSASPIGGDGDSTVWLGNTVDFETFVEYYHRSGFEDETIKTRNWATFVECFDGAQLPSVEILHQYIQEAQTVLNLEQREDQGNKSPKTELTPLSIQFPCSGALSLACCTDDDFLSIVSLCHLLYLRSKVKYKGRNAGVLIYCNDGYTETSLLALAYLIYSTGSQTSQAWLDLHVTYGRPFFCFPCDVVLLLALGPVLRKYSPALPGSRQLLEDHKSAKEDMSDIYADHNGDPFKSTEPWFSKLDGSLPSRILPHMYLGSLIHAENPELLAKLGIKRVLSVGETLTWMNYDTSETNVYDNPYDGISQLMYMDNIQDDGVDALMNSLTRCLEFLDEGYQLDEPTLVHCRVGVSRSATVCIAEVMKRLGVGLPRAYLFVRVRRLNVIIQPNLRFMFELVKWEELHRKCGEGWLREVDWHILCREIAIMNKAYIT